jgi:hypothetical protein
MKRKKLAILVLLTLSVCSHLIRASECEVEVLFSPTGGERIEARLIEALDAAQKQILVAMYSFTDEQLEAAVMRAHQRGVNVFVLTEDSQDTGAGGHEWPELVWEKIPLTADRSQRLLHHNFVVIDQHTVITGSYNGSNRGDTASYENIVVIKCPVIAKQYVDEVRSIASDSGVGWVIEDLGIQLRVVFEFVFQPDGSPNLVDGVTTGIGEIVTTADLASEGLGRHGFRFETAETASYSADLYGHYSSELGMYVLSPHVPEGGLISLGRVDLTFVRVAPGSGWAVAGDVPILKDNVYCVRTINGKYARLRILATEFMVAE